MAAALTTAESEAKKANLSRQLLSSCSSTFQCIASIFHNCFSLAGAGGGVEVGKTNRLVPCCQPLPPHSKPASSSSNSELLSPPSLWLKCR
uniref:Uncharacterized protein n=1 Tax=Ditylenchus dipsaci TaxID=166011 RepID=A0A915EPW1_9BILA